MTSWHALKRSLSIAALAALHAAVSWGLFLVAFAGTMARSEDGRPPSALELVADVSVAILWFPLGLVIERWPGTWFPGWWGYLPFLLNSLLWGVALYALLHLVLRRIAGARSGGPDGG